MTYLLTYLHTCLLSERNWISFNCFIIEMIA